MREEQEILGEFVFPQNYDIKPKILGIIEVETLFIYIMIVVLTYFITSFLTENIILKIQILIITLLPPLILMVNGIKGESLIYVVKYMIKYFFKKKVYLYQKDI